MAGLEIEWSNPIFYLNLAAFVLLGILLRKVLRLKDTNRIDGRWAFLWLVLFLGTGVHLAGDVFGLSENADHILIHGVLLLALIVPVWRLRSEP